MVSLCSEILKHSDTTHQGENPNITTDEFEIYD